MFFPPARVSTRTGHPFRTERRRRNLRPRLVMLEDRCVPSTLLVTSGDDDVNQNNTLRYAVAHAFSGNPHDGFDDLGRNKGLP